MNEIVKYNNQMNKISFTGFTKTHMDLLMAICSKVKLQGTNVVTIKTQELKDIVRFEKGGNRDFFEELDAMTEQLQKINGKIVDRTEGQRRFVKFVLFPTFEYDENGEWLTIAVNDRFAWLLNELENYTTFELAEFIELKSKYAKNLYRQLKQWRTLGKYTFNDLEEFRKLMDVPSSYSNKYMMERCVSVAIKEISELDKSFKGFNCEPVYARKRGKPLEKLVFTWRREVIPKPLPEEPREPSEEPSGDVPGQLAFGDDISFDEYIKGYKGDDKPSARALKIARNIEKGHKKKAEEPKPNGFHNFEQREYDMDALERKLLGID